MAEKTVKKMQRSVIPGSIQNHDTMFQELAKNIGNKYKEVGISLGLSFEDLRNQLETVANLMLPAPERAQIMLHMWYNQSKNLEIDFTYSKLATALENNGLQRFADKYCYRDDPGGDTYEMTAKPRGLAIIINNKNFPTLKHKVRRGTDIDAAELSQLFESYLGFKVLRYNDLTSVDLKLRLQEAAGVDHSKFDCLCVAILTHGSNGKLYGTDAKPVPVEDITSLFDEHKCPSLSGKPKVFIFQACRSFKKEKEVGDDPGMVVPASEEDVKKMEDQILDEDENDGGGYARARLPAEGHFVMAYSTLPGFVSWRRENSGSWFIQAFIKIMREEAEREHLLDILTKVNDDVAQKCQTAKGRKKQMPAPVTALRRKLYFRPGY